MRIGDRQFGDQSRATSSVRADPEAFGSGMGRALQNLGGQVAAWGLDKAQLEEAAKRKAEGNARTASAADWARWQGETQRELDEVRRQVPPGAPDYLKQTEDLLRRRRDEFEQTLPEALRDEYRARTETFVQGQLGRAFAFEFAASDDLQKQNISSVLEQAKSDVHNDTSLFEDRRDFVLQAIADSDLAELEKAALSEAAVNDLTLVEAQQRLEAAAVSEARQLTADGTDVVAPGMPGYARGILNAIASVESPGYDVLNGGERFTDYSKHPCRQGAGGTSSAAGRYQFICSTWRDLQDRYPDLLPDFSPASQDRGAWIYAQEVYQEQTGRNLVDDAASGDPALLRAARRYLAGAGKRRVWVGLDNMTDAQFAAFVTGDSGMQGGGTPPGDDPNFWTDPRYANLTHEQRLALEQRADRAVMARIEQERQAQRQLEFDIINGAADALSAGSIDAEGVAQILQSGQVRSREGQAQLRKLIQSDLEGVQDYIRMAQQIDNGVPATRDDDASLDNFAKRSGILQGLQETDQRAALDLARSFGQVGRVPPSALDFLLAQSRSANVGQKQYALDALRMMYDANPAALAAQSEKAFEKAVSWDIASKFTGTPEAALQTMEIWTDPQFQALREVRQKEATKSFSELSDKELLRAFEGSWASGFAAVGGSRAIPERWRGIGALQLPEVPQLQARFRGNMKELYERAYVELGDEDAALERAALQMAVRWGPDNSGGVNRLMELSPFSPTAGYETYGDPSWLRTEILNTMGWASDAQFELVADPESFAEAEQGERPRYRIFYQDPDNFGQWTFAQTEEGGTRFRFELSPDQIQQKQLEVTARQAEAVAEDAYRDFINEGGYAFPPGPAEERWLESEQRAIDANAALGEFTVREDAVRRRDALLQRLETLEASKPFANQAMLLAIEGFIKWHQREIERVEAEIERLAR